MSDHWTCSQGHSWDSDRTGAGQAASSGLCPVCGADGKPSAATEHDGPASAERSSHFSLADAPTYAPQQEPDASHGLARPAFMSSVSLPDHELLGELGRGGMGVVYKARHTGLDRMVAVKMILAGAFADERIVARFQAEARTVARFQHPNIVQIYDIGGYEGKPYFTMEYVSGKSLSQHLAGVPQPPREAAQMLQTLARAIHYAHERGVIHRDLKPGNVLLSNEMREAKHATLTSSPLASPPSPFLLKITDFGLAKELGDAAAGTRTSSDALLGTPQYMAPEQALDPTKVGPASDIYALGAILYEMLTGRVPFEGTTKIETIEMLLNAEPVAPDRLQPRTPRDLNTICLKCLRKEPHKRYASALELADDLGRFLAGEPIRARPIGAVERAWKWARRRPALAVALASLVVAAVTIVALSARNAAQLRRERDARHLVQARAVLTAAPDNVPYLVEDLRDAARLVAPVFRDHFQDANAEPTERLRAAIGLTVLGEPQTDFLLDAVPNAAAGESRGLVLALRALPDAEIKEALFQRARTAKDRAHQVRYAILLLELGDARAAQPLLVAAADPSPRSALIDEYRSWHGDLKALPALLRDHGDVDVRSGLCAAIGRVDPATLPKESRAVLTETLTRLYREAADGGTHSAAAWALQQWRVALPELETMQAAVGDRRWFRNGQGMTFVEVPPGAVEIAGRCAAFTRPLYVDACEVNAGVFRSFVLDPDLPPELKPEKTAASLETIDANVPVNHVSRWDMIKFCNWLSLREHRQPCYEPVDNPKHPWKCDFQADGYRLPTEPERDHLNRAGATTRWFFGEDAKWLTSYAHVAAAGPAAGGSKQPNRWGLFDTTANLWEMCWDEFASGERVAFDAVGVVGVRHVWRGGAFDSGSYDTPCVHRFFAGVGPGPTLGFRVVCAAAATDESDAGKSNRKIEALTRGLATMPDHLPMLRTRYGLCLDSARWKEAAADLARTFEREPGSEVDGMRGASLFLYVGDEDNYRRYCRVLLAKFKDTKNVVIAERIAKGCLLAPSPAADLALVSPFCDYAVKAGKYQWIEPYTLLARGMLAYRAGEYAAALDWLTKSRAARDSLSKSGVALAVLFEAMTLKQLKREAPARETLDRASQMLIADFDSLKKSSLGYVGHDIVINWVIHREAENLLTSPTRGESR